MTPIKAAFLLSLLLTTGCKVVDARRINRANLKQHRGTNEKGSDGQTKKGEEVAADSKEEEAQKEHIPIVDGKPVEAKEESTDTWGTPVLDTAAKSAAEKDYDTATNAVIAVLIIEAQRMALVSCTQNDSHQVLEERLDEMLLNPNLLYEELKSEAMEKAKGLGREAIVHKMMAFWEESSGDLKKVRVTKSILEEEAKHVDGEMSEQVPVALEMLETLKKRVEVAMRKQDCEEMGEMMFELYQLQISAVFLNYTKSLTTPCTSATLENFLVWLDQVELDPNAAFKQGKANEVD